MYGFCCVHHFTNTVGYRVVAGTGTGTDTAANRILIVMFFCSAVESCHCLTRSNSEKDKKKTLHIRITDYTYIHMGYAVLLSAVQMSCVDVDTHRLHHQVREQSGASSEVRINVLRTSY